MTLARKHTHTHTHTHTQFNRQLNIQAKQTIQNEHKF